MNNNLDKHFFTESAKDLLKKQIGQENLEIMVAGKQPGYPFETLNWRVSNFKGYAEYIRKDEVPEFAKKLIYPITQNGYRYYLTRSDIRFKVFI